MGATPYRAVSFTQDETITQDGLDQVESNLQWVKDNTPVSRFYDWKNNAQQANIAFVSGKVRVKRNHKSDSGKATVRLGKSFAPGAHPNVTVGVCADFQPRIHCTVAGLRSRGYPTSEGFEVHVNVAAEHKSTDKLLHDVWVHWMAIGRKGDDLNEF